MPITCGIDWAEAHHDVALVDAHGAVLTRSRVSADVAGFARLVELIVEHGGSPNDTPVAIETDKNLLVVALQAAGLTVFPINPLAVDRYRERHGQSGKKSDAGDAAVLAHILRTDVHRHRPLPAVSEEAAAVKVLARQHQEAIWERRPHLGQDGVHRLGDHAYSRRLVAWRTACSMPTSCPWTPWRWRCGPASGPASMASQPSPSSANSTTAVHGAPFRNERSIHHLTPLTDPARNRIRTGRREPQKRDGEV